MRVGRLALVASAVLLLGTAGLAFAQDATVPGGKLRTGNEIRVAEGETVPGDLYAFGGLVTIDGVITGDLVATAGDVTITGRVEGDVVAAAGTVTISGPVGGDVRIAAGQVDLSGDVGEDGLVGAGRLDVGGAVGADLVVGAGQVSIGGAVGGDVLGGASVYERAGSVGGVERIEVGGGDRPRGDGPVPAAIRRYAALILFGLLGIRFLRRPLTAAARLVEARPGGVLGRGLILVAVSILGPLAALFVATLFAVLLVVLGLGSWSALLLGSTMVGWVLVGFGMWVVAVFAGPVVVGLWLGDVLLPDQPPVYASLALGVGAIVVAGMFPVIGPITGLLTLLLGGGALVAVGAPGRARIPA